MDPIYEAYITTFVVEKEQNTSKGEYSIYITCKIAKPLFEQWKSLVTNLNEADEVEKDPHCTFLWAKLEEDVDPEAIYKLVKEEVDGLGFELMPMGFKVFEDVNDGTQDCLVVQLSAPGDITQIQIELKDKLIAHGVKIVEDDWILSRGN